MKDNPSKFEIIEHTADVGIKAYGKDLKELFVNAALGLFSFITDLDKVSSKAKINISLKEENQEELLVGWLNELIFQFSTRQFIPKEFRINKITSNCLEAQIQGEKINLTKHKILSEIKATTYHELSIKNNKQGFEARVIFDT